jgi:hypothetical protein
VDLAKDPFIAGPLASSTTLIFHVDAALAQLPDDQNLNQRAQHAQSNQGAFFNAVADRED